jgi:Recombination endonuclease VII
MGGKVSPEKKRAYVEANKEELYRKNRERFQKNKERYMAKQREYNALHRDEIRAKRNTKRAEEKAFYNAQKIKSKFGITPGQYQRIKEAQGGCCAICKLPKPLAVDHCHRSGRNRALLCSPCNTALGLLQEDVPRFVASVVYLRKHAAHEKYAVSPYWERAN